MNKKKLIVANWKMNKTLRESFDFIKDFEVNLKTLKNDVVICPSFTAIENLKDKLDFLGIKMGAQNCFWESEGAFTGEISAKMLADIGTRYVIVGHSERREYFSESNEIINKKIFRILENKMVPILCVGESLSARKEGIGEERVISQLFGCVSGVDFSNIKNLVVAYEPIWSIGTGMPASVESADRMCSCIRNFIAKKYGSKIAEDMRILYGGSLTASNCKDFLNRENINGGLIGGASLNPKSFGEIVNTVFEF